MTMTTDELLMRHTARAMDKILDPQQLRRAHSRTLEGSPADAGTVGVGLSAKTKMEALMLSQMNEEKAELCVNQPALQKFFEMNAKFLMEIAK